MTGTSYQPGSTRETSDAASELSVSASSTKLSNDEDDDIDDDDDDE